MFGEFVKERRLALGLSLRKFCKLLDLDPSNWSKIERGRKNPPDADGLAAIASMLNIEDQSTDWQNLFHYASIDSGRIPKEVLSDEDILPFLPVFYRSFGNVKPTRKEILELIEHLKECL